VAGVYALETSVVSAVVDVIAFAIDLAQGAELTSTWHGRHAS